MDLCPSSRKRWTNASEAIDTHSANASDQLQAFGVTTKQIELMAKSSQLEVSVEGGNDETQTWAARFSRGNS